MEEKENSYHAKTRKQWRAWLHKNHEKKDSVWLIIYKKEAGTPSVYYPEAVEEALCYGWIDSLANKRDDISYYQFFSKRKPTSNWSKINKARVANLQAQGLMMPKGIELVNLAQQTGTWTKLEEVDELMLPADLKKALAKNKKAFSNFNAFPKSSRRGILEWILNAKKPETRANRIRQTVELAAQNIKANHPKQ